MKKIKISALIPLFNSKAYLKECIESVLNQRLKDIEVICIDAGSDDGTIELIKEYMKTDSRINLIKSDKKSYGYQLNLGLNNVQGEYFSIVESDDIILPEMYEELYYIASKQDIDFIKCDFYRFKGQGEERYIEHFKMASGDKYYNRVINIQEENECALFPVNTWTGIYKTEYIKNKRIKHNESKGAAFQDNGFMFQCNMYSTKLLYVNKAYYMCRRDNPKSSVYDKNKVYAMCEEYAFILNKIKENAEILDLHWVIPYFVTVAYNNYFWNMFRLSSNVRKEYLERFRKDFQNIISDKIAESYWWKSNKQDLINTLVNKFNIYKKYIFNERDELFTALEEAKQIIIYGDKSEGKALGKILKYMYIHNKILGYAVEYVPSENAVLEGYKVRNINDYIEYKDQCLIVVSVSLAKKKKSIFLLENIGYKNILYLPVLSRIHNQSLPTFNDHQNNVIENYNSIMKKNQLILDSVNRIFDFTETDDSLTFQCNIHQYKKIILYGYGVLGKVVYREMRASTVRIIAIMDSFPEKVTGIPEDMPLLSPNDKLPEYDAIIVTAVAAFDVIKKNLTAKGYKNIVNILELV